MLHTAATLAALYGFWLLLSGHYSPFLLAAGAGGAALVLYVSRRMDVIDRDSQPFHLSPRAIFSYWPWLLIEIIKSAWDVTRRILDPRLPISPTLTTFRPSQKTDLGLVIHANSITLTPGTISVEVAPGEFRVHALTAQGAATLQDSEMDRRVSELEGSR